MNSSSAKPGAAPEAEPRAKGWTDLEAYSRLTPVSVVSSLVASLIAAAALWPSGGPAPVSMWLAAVWAHGAFALIRWNRGRARDWDPNRIPSERSIRFVTAVSAASGFLWGATSLLLFGATPLQELVVGLIVTGLAGGSVTTMSGVPRANVAFVAFSMGPLSAFFLARGDMAHLGVGIVMMGMTIAMLRACQLFARLNETRAAAIRTRNELLEQLRVERQDWRDVAELSAAYALYDPGDRLLDWSHRYPETLGVPASRLTIGMSRAEVLRLAVAPTSVESGEMTREDWIAELLLLPHSAQGERIDSFRDGRWLRSRGSLTEAGGIVVVHDDITDLIEVDAALRDSEAMFRAFLSRMPASVAFKDLDGVFRFANPRYVKETGLPASRVIGARSRDLFDEERARRIDEMDRDVLTTGEAREYLWEQALAGGRTRILSIRRFPVVGGDATPIGIGVIGLDVTAQRLEEEELRSRQQLETLGRLTGGVAHDFNNLLMAVMGNVELVMSSEELSEAMTDRLDAALSAAGQAATLTSQLLTYSSRQTLRPETVAVERVVREVEGLLEHSLPAGIALRTTIATELSPVFVDAGQLQASLLNLGMNSRDAMPEGGRLWIDVTQATLALPDLADVTDADVEPGRFVRITVRDDGTGMTPEVLQRAVEPFFTTRRLGESRGLGLSMVFGFARQSGGFTRIRSRPGRGTEVDIYLPAHEGAGDSSI